MISSYTRRLEAYSLCLMFTGCKGRWPADMQQGPAPLPQQSAVPSPPMSIPVGGLEKVEDREDVEDLKNPFASDAKSATRGATTFAKTCTPCHGKDGRGNGPVSQLVPPAPDLRYITICRRTDGFIYGTLTAGGRAMPSMREGLSSKQRWDLVSYVRQLQKQGCVGEAAKQDEDEGDDQ